jgi:hypothetical protein
MMMLIRGVDGVDGLMLHDEGLSLSIHQLHSILGNSSTAGMECGSTAIKRHTECRYLLQIPNATSGSTTVLPVCT